MTQAAIALGVALVVGTGVAAWRGALLPACLGFLVIACGFGYSLVSFEAGGLTLTLDRLALVALLGGYALRRARGGIEDRWPSGGELALGLLLAYLGVQALLARPATLPDSAPAAWRLVAGYGIPSAVYWVARESRAGAPGAARTAAVLGGLGAYLAATGLLEVAGLSGLVFPPQSADPALGLHFGRARGPMLHSVSFGTYVAVGGVAAWAALSDRGRRARKLAALSLPLFASAAFFSYTRSVWLGALSGWGTAGLLTLPRPPRRALVAAAAVVVLVSPLVLPKALSFQRGAETPSMTETSARMRAGLAFVSWRMFLDRPVLGSGFGSFPSAKLPYLEDGPEWLRLEELRPLGHHNHFLSLLTETGVVGLGLFLAVLASWVRTGWRLCRLAGAPPALRSHGVLQLSALVVVFWQWSFHELSHSPLDHGLLFLLAGVGASLGSTRAASSGAQAGPASPGAAPGSRAAPAA